MQIDGSNFLGIDLNDYYDFDKSMEGVIRCSPEEEKHIPILQNPEEMESFLDALRAALPMEDDRKVALEIGMLHGATHLIWRSQFQKVASIEANESYVISFANGMTDGSILFYGDSRKPVTARVVASNLSCPLDMLFIDGDHSYSSVEADYANYEPLVRKGGIIAFHDSIASRPVVKFLKELTDGIHLLTPPGLHLIRLGSDKGIGISYYIKG